MKYITSPQLLAKRLRQARKDIGYTQSQVCSMIDVYPSYISKIEHNARQITVLELIDFAKLYQKDLLYFLEDVDLEKAKLAGVRSAG